MSEPAHSLPPRQEGHTAAGDSGVPRPPRSEPELRQAIVQTLRAHGIKATENVTCRAGEADIVTARRDVVIEVKWQLSRKALFAATGQVLVYRHVINPAGRAVIVGHETPETRALVPILNALGVEVVCWQDRSSAEGQVLEAEENEQPHAAASSTQYSVHHTKRPSLDAPHKTLRWNVATLARERGIRNPAALGAAMGIARQGLYGIWEGTAQSVSLHILALLVHVLDADPGDWFARAAPDAEVGVLSSADNSSASDIQRPALIWAVRAAAEARGLDAPRFGFKTELHPRSVGFIWRGRAQAIAVDTLGKIARVLDRSDLPFSIGTIFVWDNLPSGKRESNAVDDQGALT